MNSNRGQVSLTGRAVRWVRDHKYDIQDTCHFVLRVVLFPFKVIAFVWRAAETSARAIILGFIHFLFVMFGLIFVGFVSFAFIRVIFHPLF